MEHKVRQVKIPKAALPSVQMLLVWIDNIVTHLRSRASEPSFRYISVLVRAWDESFSKYNVASESVLDSLKSFRGVLESLFAQSNRALIELIEILGEQDDLGRLVEAIDKFLHDLLHAKVRVEYKYSDSDLDELAGEWNGKEALTSVVQGHLRALYNYDDLFVRLKQGNSTHAFFELPLINGLPVWFTSPPVAENTKVKGVQNKTSVYNLLKEGQRTPIMDRLLHFTGESADTSLNLARDENIMRLIEIGVKSAVAAQILPEDHDLYEHYSLIQHIEEYLDDLSATDGLDDPTVFAERVLEVGGQAFKELERFYHEEPDHWLSPASWFFGYCDDIIGRSWDIISTSSQINVKATTTPTATSPIAAIPSVRKRTADVTQGGWQAVATALGLQLPTQREYWFHGTTWGKAESILARGILPSKGREDLDFGRSRGFYLTDDFSRASAWAVKKAGQHAVPVVLIFQVDVNHVQTNFTCLDLTDYATNTNTQGQWRTVVSNSRDGQPSAADNKDMISGPVAKVPRNRGPQWVPAPKTPMFTQYAIKTDLLAAMFNGYAAGVLVLV